MVVRRVRIGCSILTWDMARYGGAGPRSAGALPWRHVSILLWWITTVVQMDERSIFSRLICEPRDVRSVYPSTSTTHIPPTTTTTTTTLPSPAYPKNQTLQTPRTPYHPSPLQPHYHTSHVEPNHPALALTTSAVLGPLACNILRSSPRDISVHPTNFLPRRQF
jgi:hypothetical protein